MTLNKQKGNMYPFVTHTWNPIKGTCPHKCSYCYMKRFPQGELRLDEKCLKDNLGEGNFIFIGSSTDMFNYYIADSWIDRVFNRMDKYPNNTFLFQTKNPVRYNLLNMIPLDNTIFGVTIETNRNYQKSVATIPYSRYLEMIRFKAKRKMISIEPIMDFDLDIFVKWIKDINPEFVSIGADSKNSKLQEPTSEKVKKLIEELEKFTEVKIKDNLKRLSHKEGIRKWNYQMKNIK